MLRSQGRLLFCDGANYGEGPWAPGHRRDRPLEQTILDRTILAQKQMALYGGYDSTYDMSFARTPRHEVAAMRGENACKLGGKALPGCQTLLLPTETFLGQTDSMGREIPPDRRTILKYHAMSFSDMQKMECCQRIFSLIIPMGCAVSHVLDIWFLPLHGKIEITMIFSDIDCVTLGKYDVD